MYVMIFLCMITCNMTRRLQGAQSLRRMTKRITGALLARMTNRTMGLGGALLARMTIRTRRLRGAQLAMRTN